MPTLNDRKAQLTKRLGELDSRLNEIENDLDAPMSQDWEDRAAEREGDEVLESMGNAGLREIAMINAALGRIEDGTYGDCARCGDAISDERLDLLPHTPMCRNCAGAV